MLSELPSNATREQLALTGMQTKERGTLSAPSCRLHMRADSSRCLVSVTRPRCLPILFHLEQLCLLLVRSTVL